MTGLPRSQYPNRRCAAVALADVNPLAADVERQREETASFGNYRLFHMSSVAIGSWVCASVRLGCDSLPCLALPTLFTRSRVIFFPFSLSFFNHISFYAYTFIFLITHIHAPHSIPFMPSEQALSRIETLATYPIALLYLTSSLPLPILPYVPLGIMSSIFNALFRSASAAASTAPTPPSATPIPPIASSDPTKPTASNMNGRDASPEASPGQKRFFSEPNPSTAKQDPYYPSSPFTPGSGDHSYDISTSTLSDTADIVLPRGIPFVQRRQIAAQIETGSTPPMMPAYYQPSPTHGRPGITIRDPRDTARPVPAPKATPVPLPKVEIEAKPTQLTEWRKEQIRRQNPPRLIEPIVARPITTLYGPSNLPYARCPT
jgi:hypothetical protein